MAAWCDGVVAEGVGFIVLNGSEYDGVKINPIKVLKLLYFVFKRQSRLTAQTSISSESSNY